MTDSSTPTLSVLIITRNAERLLRQVLESVAWADEIVIVDSGSTDGTEAIARDFTEHFHYKPYAGHGAQRQRSMELSTGEWILFVDADEIVTPVLRESILESIRKPKGRAGFRVQLHTWFFGRWFGRRGWRKEWKVRLFHRDLGHFSDVPIHEGAVVPGRIGSLRGNLLHYPYRDIEHFVEKNNLYSSSMAREHYRHGRRGTAAGALVRGVANFFRDYIFGGDFLNGGQGLFRSAMFGYYTFLKYAKVWEAGLEAEEGSEPPGTTRISSR